MKEVTEWNGKPRWMLCWDDNEDDKVKQFVACILTKEEMKEANYSHFPVFTSNHTSWKHCAEIEEEKRPCTREELLEMLKKQGLSFLLKKTVNACTIYINYTVAIKIIDNEEVTMGNGECYKYEDLCKHYTLLDGTELWIEE